MADNNNFYPACWNNPKGSNRSYAQSLDPSMHGVESYRTLDSKFIGPNKRISVKVNGYSHPMPHLMNKAVRPDTTNASSPLNHASKVGNRFLSERMWTLPLVMAGSTMQTASAMLHSLTAPLESLLKAKSSRGISGVIPSSSPHNLI